MRLIITIPFCLLCNLLLTTSVFADRRRKRTEVHFDSDTDVKTYLQERQKDMLIFKCKKVVMLQWLHSVVPYVDLECEVLGEVNDVKWYFNDTLLQTGVSSRFISLSQPHYRKRIFYNTWFDYKLRLLQVTEAYNGPYSLEITSPSGYKEHRDIMLEVKTNYRDDKWTQWIEQVEKDRDKLRSARRAEKERQKELMRQLKKRAEQRKLAMSNIPIFDK